MMSPRHAYAVDASVRCYPELAGKRVLVTGAERSFGFSIAKAFMRQQSRLVMQASRLGASRRISGNALRVFECRPRTAEEIHRLADAAALAHAGLDVYVAIAALEPGWRDLAAADPEGVVAEALRLPFLTAQRVAERMRMGNIRGTLITVALLPSPAGVGAAGRILLHTALAGLVRRQDEELGSDGIRAYGIAAEPLVAAAFADADDSARPGIARIGQGRAIAEIALSLASPKASFLSGQTLTA